MNGRRSAVLIIATVVTTLTHVVCAAAQDEFTADAARYQSLKPGGRLAIIDFPPDSAESADPAQRSDGGQHGVTPPTVVRELRQAGFELVSVEEGTRRRGFMVVMRRPSSIPSSSRPTELLFGF